MNKKTVNYLSVKINQSDSKFQEILKQLLTKECFSHFYGKRIYEDNTYNEHFCGENEACQEFVIEEKDIIEYYLRKPELTLNEQNLLTEYFDKLLDDSRFSLECDMNYTLYQDRISELLSEEFISQINPVVKKYLIGTIIEYIKLKAGESYV